MLGHFFKFVIWKRKKNVGRFSKLVHKYYKYKYYLAENIDCFFQRGLEASKEEKQKLLATTYVTKWKEKVECPRYFVTHCKVLYNFSDCSRKSTFVNMFGCLNKQTYFQTYLL